MFSHFLVRDALCGSGASPACLDWPSGYRFAGGEPKPALSTLRAGLFVRPLAGGRTYLWGRIGEIFRPWRLEYERDGVWWPLGSADVESASGGGPEGSSRPASVPSASSTSAWCRRQARGVPRNRRSGHARGANEHTWYERPGPQQLRLSPAGRPVERFGHGHALR